MAEKFVALVDPVLKPTIEAHYIWAAFIIVALIIMLIVCWRKETYEVGRGIGYGASGGNVKYRVAGDQFVQSAVGGPEPAQAAYTGKVAAPKVASWAMSPSEQILSSPEFHCETRTDVGDDAWGWMVGDSKKSYENAVGGSAKQYPKGGKTEGDFSRLLAGQN